MMDKQQAQKIADEYYKYGAVFSDDVDDVLIFRQRVPEDENAVRGGRFCNCLCRWSFRAIIFLAHHVAGLVCRLGGLTRRLTAR